MWNYEKRLQYPINIKNCNPTLAAMIIHSMVDRTANWGHP